jgi:hypothetical protein
MPVCLGRVIDGQIDTADLVEVPKKARAECRRCVCDDLEDHVAADVDRFTLGECSGVAGRDADEAGLRSAA